MKPVPPADDALACQAVFFEWAESYDLKDWKRLESCLAPVLEEDYRSLGGPHNTDTPASKFVSYISRPDLLGNPRTKTQHLLGASKWEKTSDTEIVGHHQIRAGHQKYTDDTCQVAQYQGFAYGTNTYTYKKIDGLWKLAGLGIGVRWATGDMEKIIPPSS